MTIELTTGKTLSISAADTALALQYSATAGLPELVKFLRELQQREHEPKGYGDADANMNANANANANADGNANANANASQPPFDMCVFNGSQEGLAKVDVSVRVVAYVFSYTALIDATCKAFEMLITPGDHVLVESPMYR